MNTRKNIRNMEEAELGNIREAFRRIMELKDNRGYRHLAGHHGIPDNLCVHDERFTPVEPNARLFLPWHRAYLYTFELAIQDAGENRELSIPWWDWTSELSRTEGIPRAFSEPTVGEQPNPLYSYHMKFSEFESPNRPLDEDTERDPDPPSELPASNEIARLYDPTSGLPDYGDFSDQLEIIHNRIHVWFNGSMSEVDTAAFDPMFWLHHTMIDRIWWLWQLKQGNPSSGIPPSLMDIVLVPFGRTVKQVLNIYELGYTYGSASVSVDF
jgi:tyrosinase